MITYLPIDRNLCSRQSAMLDLTSMTRHYIHRTWHFLLSIIPKTIRSLSVELRYYILRTDNCRETNFDVDDEAMTVSKVHVSKVQKMFFIFTRNKAI